MPIHDWSRVSAGIFHAFHCAWVPRLSEALNAGILPGVTHSTAARPTIAG